MIYKMNESFVVFQICAEVSNHITKDGFQNVFGEHAEIFWNFWNERAKGRLQLFYDNINHIGHGIGTRIHAKEKFEAMIAEITTQILDKHGYKLVKV